MEKEQVLGLQLGKPYWKFVYKCDDGKNILVILYGLN